MITQQEIKKTRSIILARKLQQDYSARANLFFHPSVRKYARSLGLELSEFVFEQMQRAQNGFQRMTLTEQLQKMSTIKPLIDLIADVDNPNHPHIGVAREFAEQTFYRVMEIYTPLLEKSYLIN